MKYHVDGACIVDKLGAILYDILEDMPERTRQRLAELHSQDDTLDWEGAAEQLEREGYALKIEAAKAD